MENILALLTIILTVFVNISFATTVGDECALNSYCALSDLCPESGKGFCSSGEKCCHETSLPETGESCGIKSLEEGKCQDSTKEPCPDSSLVDATGKIKLCLFTKDTCCKPVPVGNECGLNSYCALSDLCAESEQGSCSTGVKCCDETSLPETGESCGIKSLEEGKCQDSIKEPCLPASLVDATGDAKLCLSSSDTCCKPAPKTGKPCGIESLEEGICQDSIKEPCPGSSLVDDTGDFKLCLSSSDTCCKPAPENINKIFGGLADC